MLNRFDAVRLAAALAVMVAHGDFLYRLHLPVPFQGHSLGSLAVYVFFFVSGYLVTQSWERAPAWRVFWIKRIARIFPGLAVAVAFSVFVLGWMVTELPGAQYLREPGTWLNFVNNALALATVQTLPGVFETNPFARTVNGSLWTIRYELAMYLLLAIVASGAKGRRWMYPLAAGALALLWVVARQARWDEALEASGNWVSVLFRWQDFCGFGVPFFLGGVFAVFGLRVRGWMLAGALMAALLASVVASDVLRQFAVWGLVALGTFYVAHVAVSARSTAGRGRIDLSYGVYIYAFPVQQAFTQWSLRNGWPFEACLAASFLVVLALAWGSWWAVESPCIQAAQRWAARRRLMPAVGS